MVVLFGEHTLNWALLVEIALTITKRIPSPIIDGITIGDSTNNSLGKYKIISITEYVILLGISEISELMNKYWSEILCRKLSDLGIYIRILLTIISVLLIIGKIKNCTMKSKKL